MASNVLQKLKDKLWSSGGETTAPTPQDPGPARYDASEVASLKQQRSTANAAAKAEAGRRGKKVNPRVALARQSGVNI